MDTLKPMLQNPYRSALITIGGLVGLAALATILSLGLFSVRIINLVFGWISLVFLAIFGLMWLAIWLLGVLQIRRAVTFLASDRLLVRWTYSTAEWQQLKESLWREEKSDWKIQWSCLTVLLGSAGLLTGVMLGLEGDFLNVVINGMVGFMLGGLAGALIGAFVAGGNFLGARQFYQRSEPGEVALGIDEIYASGDYFRGDGVSGFIRRVTLHRNRTTTLEFQLVVPPRPRMPREEQWIILVPEQFVEKVEEILPRLAPYSENQALE
jgi:hypothetical protein